MVPVLHHCEKISLPSAKSIAVYLQLTLGRDGVTAAGDFSDYVDGLIKEREHKKINFAVGSGTGRLS